MIINAGTAIDRYRYSAWGTVTQDSGSDDYRSFTGKDYDATGLLYFNARYYDPLTARFLTQDPAMKGGNWYAYCGNNPLSCFDPTGKNLEEVERIVKAIDPDLDKAWEDSFPPGAVVREMGGDILKGEKGNFFVGHVETQDDPLRVTISYGDAAIGFFHTQPANTGSVFSPKDIKELAKSTATYDILESGTQRFALEISDRTKALQNVQSGAIDSKYNLEFNKATAAGISRQASELAGLKAVLRIPNSGLKAYQTEKYDRPYPSTSPSPKVRFEEIK